MFELSAKMNTIFFGKNVIKQLNIHCTAVVLYILITNDGFVNTFPVIKFHAKSLNCENVLLSSIFKFMKLISVCVNVRLRMYEFNFKNLNRLHAIILLNGQ